MENQYSMALVASSRGGGQISESKARERKNTVQNVVTWLLATLGRVPKWSLEVALECSELEPPSRPTQGLEF